VEYFVLAKGERGPGEGPHKWESDLFSGLEVGPPAIADTAAR
jgi:N-acetyl-1-D-myo-inositol-2-amino-2-deoxy-alpha-D-glucopyranoside deacetylase